MKYYLMLILVLWSKVGLCQEKLSPLKEGVYSGGICIDEGICGLWFIKSDSSFIFASFEDENLRNIGTGSWHLVNDSTIAFTFKDSLLPILQALQTEYSSTNGASYDSIYISGQLKNPKGIGISSAHMRVEGKYQIRSDDNGYFKAVFPRKVKMSKFEAINTIRGYELVEVYLSPSNNMHTLNITLPLIDSSTCTNRYSNRYFYYPPDNDFRFRIRDRRKKDKSPFFNIEFKSEDKNFLISKLLLAKKNQPYLEANINELIELIQK